jgi:hypothetical protein
MKRYRQAKLASLDVHGAQVVQGGSEIEFGGSEKTFLRRDDPLCKRQSVWASSLAVSNEDIDEQIGRPGQLERVGAELRLDIVMETSRLALRLAVNAAIDQASDSMRRADEAGRRL